MKPAFTVTILGSGAAPCKVGFTDQYQKPEERIWRFDFGDGHLYEWDTPTQTYVEHEYTHAGKFSAKAIAADRVTQSDIVTVVIRDGSTPEPVESWWTRLWSWFKGLFGWK